jgi:hypothetical protein
MQQNTPQGGRSVEAAAHNLGSLGTSASKELPGSVGPTHSVRRPRKVPSCSEGTSTDLLWPWPIAHPRQRTSPEDCIRFFAALSPTHWKDMEYSNALLQFLMQRDKAPPERPLSGSLKCSFLVSKMSHALGLMYSGHISKEPQERVD